MFTNLVVRQLNFRVVVGEIVLVKVCSSGMFHRDETRQMGTERAESSSDAECHRLYVGAKTFLKMNLNKEEITSQIIAQLKRRYSNDLLPQDEENRTGTAQKWWSMCVVGVEDDHEEMMGVKMRGEGGKGLTLLGCVQEAADADESAVEFDEHWGNSDEGNSFSNRDCIHARVDSGEEHQCDS
jgi:hypothetical protein